MPVVKLCGYLVQVDKFKQYHIRFCDDRGLSTDRIIDTQNTQYKLRQLIKSGGDNPVHEDKFVVKTKKKSNVVIQSKEKKDCAIEKIMGSLVEVTAAYRRYSFGNKFGWSLDIISICAV